MKINEKLGAISMILTLILVIGNSVHAEVTRDAREEKAIWIEIQAKDTDIANSEEKATRLREAVKLVDNHIEVQTELKNDLKDLLDDIHKNGSIQLSKTLNPNKIANMDLLALTKAIIQHETAYFKKGYGASHNNGCGIMWWPNGKGSRTIVRYETKQVGFDACYSLVKRKYQEYTIKSMADKWSGGDRVESWANNVQYWYDIYSS